MLPLIAVTNLPVGQENVDVVTLLTNKGAKLNNARITNNSFFIFDHKAVISITFFVATNLRGKI